MILATNSRSILVGTWFHSNQFSFDQIHLVLLVHTLSVDIIEIDCIFFIRNRFKSLSICFVFLIVQDFSTLFKLIICILLINCMQINAVLVSWRYFENPNMAFIVHVNQFSIRFSGRLLQTILSLCNFAENEDKTHLLSRVYCSIDHMVLGRFRYNQTESCFCNCIKSELMNQLAFIIVILSG